LHTILFYLCNGKENVKRFISILFIATAGFVLQAVEVVPHHHHDGLPCIAASEHTDLPDGCGHDTCLAESEYIAPKTIDEIKCRITSCRNHDFSHLFPVLFLAADFLSFTTEIPASGITCGEDILLLYKSSDTGPSHGLRAPPFVIS
jgi:hypothetical protein